MTLDIISDFIEWLDDTFGQLEKLVEDHFENPVMWIVIVAVILLIVGMAFNTLSK